MVLGRVERGACLGAVAAGTLLRPWMIWRFGVSSDEPQHLHVVWGWTHGLLPYRDVFDNHAPLFHVLSIPGLLAVGERPDAVLWMRLFLLPLWVACLLPAGGWARGLLGGGAAGWSAGWAGFFPLFFFCSLEYPPDTLWTVLWLGAVAIAVREPLTPRWGLAIGLVLGTAVAVSLKT